MSDSGTFQFFALVGGVTVLSVLFYLFQVARRARELLGFRIRRAAVGLLLYGSSCIVLVKLGYSTWESLAFSLLLGLTPIIFVRPPRRSRYIRASVKRQVLARDNQGRPLDSRRHHLHHVVPYSKGGDNSPGNLRVATREDNLRHGAKMPGFLEFVWHKPKLYDESDAATSPSPFMRLIRFVLLLGLIVLGWHIARNEWPAAKKPDDLAVRSVVSAPVLPAPKPLEITHEPQAAEQRSKGSAQVSASDPTLSVETAVPTAEFTRQVVIGGTEETASVTGSLPPGVSQPPNEASSISEPPTKTYTTSELFAMYRADKRGADRLLKGSMVQVVGTLTKVGGNDVTLREPGDHDAINCKFGFGKTAVRYRSVLGTTVTVRGMGEGRGLTGNIRLGDCRLISPSPF